MDDKIGDWSVNMLEPNINDEARIQKSLLTSLPIVAVMVRKSHFDGTFFLSGDNQALCKG